jgi:hypothetical protein
MGLINTNPRGLKPWKHVHLDWRGGQVWSVSAPNMTLRVQAEQSMIRDYVVSQSLLPTAILGDPVVVRVAGAWPYTIAEVRPSRFAGSGPGSNQAAAVAAGRFDPGVITSNEDASLVYPFLPER